MKKSISISLLTLGIVSIVCAVLGLLYNAAMIAVAVSGAFERLIQEHSMPFFYTAFYVMASICILFYLFLIFCGIHFIRRSVRYVWLFVCVLMIEIVYFFSIGAIGWHLSTASTSIAGATGVANGGLMAQFFILFPLWGSVLSIWLKRQNDKNI